MADYPQPPTPLFSGIPLKNEGRKGCIRQPGPIETSDGDSRQFQRIRLQSGADFLLVRDPHADRASVATTVGVGYYSDGDTPGIAQAVGEALFHRNEKYPELNAFRKYITKYAGTLNTNTVETTTTLSFDIDAKFKDGPPPIYTAIKIVESVARAIDSKHKERAPLDSARVMQVQKSRSNTDHPWSKFSGGTYDTLKPEACGKTTCDKMAALHQKYYTLSRMKTVILSPEPLENMENNIAELFSDLEEGEDLSNHWEGKSPLRSQDLMTWIFVTALQGLESVEFEFPVPDETGSFEFQPSKYLQYIIEDRGPESIFSSLREKGWVTEVFASMKLSCPGSKGIFACRLLLTETGRDQWKDVVTKFISDLAISQQESLLETIFDDIRAIEDIKFRQSHKVSSIEFTHRISSRMHIMPPGWVVSGYKCRRFDLNQLQEFWDCLRLDNCRVTVISPHLKCDHTEKWYGAKYSYGKMLPDLLAKINSSRAAAISDVRLLRPNRCLPITPTFKVLETKSQANVVKDILNDGIIRCWCEPKYKELKASLFVCLRNPVLYTSARYTAWAVLYSAIVEDRLREALSDAHRLGLVSSLYAHHTGIVIQIYGYNELLLGSLEIVLRVLRVLQDIEIDERQFARVKKRTVDPYRCVEAGLPCTHAIWLAKWLTGDSHSDCELTDELESIMASDIRQFCPFFFGQMHIQLFAYGNVVNKDVIEFADLIKATLKPRGLPKTQWSLIRSPILPSGTYVYRKALHPDIINSSIEYLVFLGEGEVAHAKTLLLSQMLKEPAFRRLVMEAKLGHKIDTDPLMAKTAYYCRIAVEGGESPEYMEGHIRDFLTRHAGEIAGMSTKEFEEIRSASVAKCVKQPDNTRLESIRRWTEILDESLDFNKRVVVNEILALKKEDILGFYNHSILSPNSATLIIKLASQHPAKGVMRPEPHWPEIPYIEIKDVRRYRSQMPLSRCLERPISEFVEQSPLENILSSSL
ncbi:hypothetical protein OIDMADRAFT_36033 [Oidiodendron maius Zn]|uniref:Peptidase M16 middle/third domain-containing protein n=1 Tax=Oidiodendron maius (strain Zn) TaxID=913774 RepID=A0A0C3GAA3_OIDMZ|nr:hypothetical protein OIDMADRAFT_36033 [Oidiodendron maius Zn]